MISNDHEIVPSRSPQVAAPVQNAAVDQEPADSPFAMIDRIMRGRWRLAIALGLVLGTVMGVAGYRRAAPMYMSSGRLHVAPKGREILYRTEDTDQLTGTGFSSTVASLAASVQSIQTIEAALVDEDIADLPLLDHPNAIDTIQEGLTAKHRRGSELITVTYEGPDALECQRILAAIMRAFETAQGWQNESEARRKQKERRLELQETFQKQVDAASIALRVFIDEDNSRALTGDQRLQSKVTRLEDARLELRQLDFDLARLEEDVSEEVGLVELTEEQVLEANDELRRLQMARDGIALEIELALRNYRATHQHVVRLQRELEAAEGRFDTAMQSALAAGIPEVFDGRPGEEVMVRRDFVAGMIKTLEDEVDQLITDIAEKSRLESELESASADLAMINQKIEQDEVEAKAVLSGRISVRERANLPRRPSSDKRKKYAAMGVGGGFMLSFGMFFLLGTLDRRTFAASQFSDSGAEYSCIGVLPDIGGNLDKSDIPETAAQCIHQIRNRLEVLRPRGSSYMIVVTSPHQGDGKTSVAMSLGWSYAMSGHRTLLVDCDFYGRNLTTQMGLSHQAGLREALRSRRLNGEVQGLGVENLSGLGIGLDRAFGPESIRRGDFLNLCNGLRRSFDIIIADTGPFVGSVELLPVAAASNGVLFAVRRGRSRARLTECIRDLNSIKVPCLGVVLNRAGAADCARYISKSTVSRPEFLDEESSMPTVTQNPLLRALTSAGSESDTETVGESQR